MRLCIAMGPYSGYNTAVGLFDEPIGKTVSRRSGANEPIEDAAILLDTIARLNAGGICRRGVWRFASFEEADQWALNQLARVPARRS